MLAHTITRRARLSFLSAVVALFATAACGGDYSGGLGPNLTSNSGDGATRQPGTGDVGCAGITTADLTEYCALGQATSDSRIVDDLGRVLVCACANDGQF